MLLTALATYGIIITSGLGVGLFAILVIDATSSKNKIK